MNRSRQDSGKAGKSLARVLSDVAAGRFPAPDGGVTIVPQPSPRDCGVIGLTAHAVIFTDADPDWVRRQLPPGDLSGPLSPPFLQALCAATGRQAHSIDMLCVAPPLSGPLSGSLSGPLPVALAAEPDAGHPRIARALRYRDDVRAWRADGGVVLLGRGVAGRWETAVEVDPACRGRGLGRALARAARHLVPGGEPLWAQVAPANAASVRAFLAAGFIPVGAEALLAADPAARADPARPGRASARPRSPHPGGDATIDGMSDTGQVTDNHEKSRFELTADGQMAELVYRRRADRLVLVHTGVPESLGGRGIGGILVQAAVDRAAAEHLTVVPLCPFARSWLERRPDVASTVTVDWGEPPDD